MSFDKYSELDPAKFQRDLEELHGSAIFDKYAVLDDAHRVQQIETAFDVEISNDALLDPARLIVEVSVVGEGGGGDNELNLQLDGNNLQLEGQDLILDGA